LREGGRELCPTLGAVDNEAGIAAPLLVTELGGRHSLVTNQRFSITGLSVFYHRLSVFYHGLAVTLGGLAVVDAVGRRAGITAYRSPTVRSPGRNEQDHER